MLLPLLFLSSSACAINHFDVLRWRWFQFCSLNLTQFSIANKIWRHCVRFLHSKHQEFSYWIDKNCVINHSTRAFVRNFIILITNNANPKDNLSQCAVYLHFMFQIQKSNNNWSQFSMRFTIWNHISNSMHWFWLLLWDKGKKK